MLMESDKLVTERRLEFKNGQIEGVSKVNSSVRKDRVESEHVLGVRSAKMRSKGIFLSYVAIDIDAPEKIRP